MNAEEVARVPFFILFDHPGESADMNWTGFEGEVAWPAASVWVAPAIKPPHLWNDYTWEEFGMHKPTFWRGPTLRLQLNLRLPF